jgi:hypothetical protein
VGVNELIVGFELLEVPSSSLHETRANTENAAIARRKSLGSKNIISLPPFFITIFVIFIRGNVL